MEQITLIKRSGATVNLFSRNPLRTVSHAVQEITMMSDDIVNLTVKSTELIDFEIGDKIIIGNDEYFLRTVPSREIIHERLFSYDLKFYGVIYELIKSQYRDTDENGLSKRSSFDLTYSIADFIKVLINNMNRDYPGLWVFDDVNCPDSEPITMSFSKHNCLQVLQNVCREFKYDFVIDQVDGTRIIKIGKFGSVVVPPAGNSHFEYGKGKGLFSLREKKIDDKSIITRLWVEGGTQNIKSAYRNYSDRLQLPYPARNNSRQHVLSDGTIIEPNTQTIGITSDINRYIEDIALRNDLGSIEDTEYYDEIYPKRTGEITSLGADIYSFIDNQMDFDLKAKDVSGNTIHLIDGVSAKITFITGKLAGMQFELADYNHTTKTFKIVRYTDERGLSFPTEGSTAFRFDKFDKYKITDINLPESYILNAEEDLWFAGYDTFLKRKQPMAQYELVFDRSYFKRSLPSGSVASVFKCGDYVPVKDVRFNVQKNIRIQKVARNLLNEHGYSITLSDVTTVNIYNKTVIDVIEHGNILERNRLKDPNVARRSWRTTEELKNMVYDTDGFFDVENIRPNSIETNMITVGSRSQQFMLVESVLQANVNGNPNAFQVTAGKLIHLSIDETIKTWNLPLYNETLASNNGYYVFAKCSKTTNNGVFIATQTQHKVEDTSDPNNYYFLVGIISSLDTVTNFRDYQSTYGFTRINGNQITTGRIKSADGSTYLDLDNNEFGGKIKFVSTGGDEIYLSDWIDTTETQIGETKLFVEYSVDGDTGWHFPFQEGDMYMRQKLGEAGTWSGKIKITGEPGVAGRYIKNQYAKNTNKDNAPTTGWQDTQPVLSVGEYLWMRSGEIVPPATQPDSWNTPIRVTPKDGVDGISSYTHIRYSMYSNGNPMLTNPTGALYIGFANTTSPTAPTSYSQYSWSKIKGEDGSSGTSITRVVAEFAINNNATTAPTTGWQEGTLLPTTANPQLWTRTKSEYSSGNPTYSSAINITPKEGAAGRGVDRTEVHYGISDSKTTQPTSWYLQAPAWEYGKYIWTRISIFYTDSPTVRVVLGVSVSSEWEAVDGIEIGGINLLKNGNFLAGINHWNLNYNQSLLEQPPVITMLSRSQLPNGVVLGAQIETKHATNQGIWQNFVDLANRLELGKQYILSFIAKSVDSPKTLLFGYEQSGLLKSVTLSTSWQGYEYRFTPTSYQNIVFSLVEIGKFHITNIQLERGNKRTAFRNELFIEEAVAGSTEINGGFMLTNLIGAKDVSGEVRSYMNGLISRDTAFAAGVTGFGTANETKNIDLKHDGSGHLAKGRLRWTDDGKLYMGEIDSGKEIQIITETTPPYVNNKGIYEIDTGIALYDQLVFDAPDGDKTSAKVTYTKDFELTHDGLVTISAEINASYSGGVTGFGWDGVILVVNKATNATVFTGTAIGNSVYLELTQEPLSKGVYTIMASMECGGTPNDPTPRVYCSLFFDGEYQLKVKKLFIGIDGIYFYDSVNNNEFRLSLADTNVMRGKGNMLWESSDGKYAIEVTNTSVRKKINGAWSSL